METNFLEFKEEILKRAKAANACVGEYKRAYSSESFSELMQVIKDNFNFACFKEVIDSELIKLYENQFNENKIYCNVDVSKGFLLACDNATVEAWDSVTVEAWGSATVEASDSATVEASGRATVKACDNATVKAWDSATVKAWGSATVEAWDSATVEASDSATVEAWGSATVKACDNATVEASGSAYITSYSIIECKLSENAIYRIRKSNKIRYVSDNIKFEKA